MVTTKRRIRKGATWKKTLQGVLVLMSSADFYTFYCRFTPLPHRQWYTPFPSPRLVDLRTDTPSTVAQPGFYFMGHTVTDETFNVLYTPCMRLPLPPLWNWDSSLSYQQNPASWTVSWNQAICGRKFLRFRMGPGPLCHPLAAPLP